MIVKIISGGQTGADLAGLRAARALGLATGGWMPKGFMTEVGPRRWVADLYGLRESSLPGYADRTSRNLKEADVTLICAYRMSAGSALTRDMCFHYERHVFHANQSDMLSYESCKEIAAWLKARKPQVLNIAGNRESVSPGIGKVTKAFLLRLIPMVNA